MIGPYLAHRMLLWDLKGLVDEAAAESAPRIEDALDEKEDAKNGAANSSEEQDGGDWWDDDPAWKGIWDAEGSGTGDERGPATTWPLGEIVASRHDQLFSRVFNS